MKSQRIGLTVMRLHSWYSADSMRRIARQRSYPTHFFIKSRPCTIITMDKTISNCKLLKKIQAVHDGHVSIIYAPNIGQMNDKLALYRQKYGPIHVTIYFNGINYNKYISINADGTLQICVKYSPRCCLFNQNIKIGDCLVNKKVLNLYEAKTGVILSLLYLRGLEAGIP